MIFIFTAAIISLFLTAPTHAAKDSDLSIENTSDDWILRKRFCNQVVEALLDSANFDTVIQDQIFDKFPLQDKVEHLSYTNWPKTLNHMRSDNDSRYWDPFLFLLIESYIYIHNPSPPFQPTVFQKTRETLSKSNIGRVPDITIVRAALKVTHCLQCLGESLSLESIKHLTSLTNIVDYFKTKTLNAPKDSLSFTPLNVILQPARNYWESLLAHIQDNIQSNQTIAHHHLHSLSSWSRTITEYTLQALLLTDLTFCQRMHSLFSHLCPGNTPTHKAVPYLYQHTPHAQKGAFFFLMEAFALHHHTHPFNAPLFLQVVEFFHKNEDCESPVKVKVSFLRDCLAITHLLDTSSAYTLQEALRQESARNFLLRLSPKVRDESTPRRMEHFLNPSDVTSGKALQSLCLRYPKHNCPISSNLDCLGAIRQSEIISFFVKPESVLLKSKQPAQPLPTIFPAYLCHSSQYLQITPPLHSYGFAHMSPSQCASSFFTSPYQQYSGHMTQRPQYFSPPHRGNLTLASVSQPKSYAMPTPIYSHSPATPDVTSFNASHAPHALMPPVVTSSNFSVYTHPYGYYHPHLTTPNIFGHAQHSNRTSSARSYCTTPENIQSFRINE